MKVSTLKTVVFLVDFRGIHGQIVTMGKESDPEFAEHFKNLCIQAGAGPKQFEKNRIGHSTYARALSGIRPVRDDVKNKFAATLRCTIDEFLNPPIKRDWERPDVQAFLGVDSDLITFDTAIAIHRGRTRPDGKKEWLPSEIELDVLKKLRSPESQEFQRLVDGWKSRNPTQKNGVKYCVTKTTRLASESSDTLTIQAQPIEYYYAKAVGEHLGESLIEKGISLDAESPSARFRNEHFAKLEDPNRFDAPNMLSVQVSVIANDGNLLLFKRPADGLAWESDCWCPSFEETLNADWEGYLEKRDVHSPLSKTDYNIGDAVRRGLDEELRLSPKK